MTTRMIVIASLSIIMMLVGDTLATDTDKSGRVEPNGDGWCQTRKVYRLNNAIEEDGRNCPNAGICDEPAERDLWIPAVDDTIKVFRLFFNVFTNDGGGDSTITVANINDAVAAMNDHFLDARIQFVYDYRYVADSRYRDMDGFEEISEAKALYAVDPELQCNIFVATSAYSFAIFPFDWVSLTAQGGIVLDPWFFPPNQYTTLTHEMGHSLGLWHTHHGVTEVPTCSACYESPMAPNRDYTGDYCSDTHPTPPVRVCDPTFDLDVCTGSSFAPGEPHNFMSYTPWQCRTEFTSQQNARMHCWSSGVLEGWVAAVDIQADIVEGPAPLEVNFGATSDKTVLDWSWNLGDVSGAEMQNLSHTFDKPGLYDVSVTIQTPEESYSHIRREYIWAQGDTLRISEAVIYPGVSTRLDVFAVNSLPLSELWIPFAWSGELDLQLDSATTTGLRTEIMPYQQLVSYSPSNKRATYMLRTTRPNGFDELSADSGTVVSLWFTSVSGSTGDLSPVSFTSYSTYTPKFVARRAEVTPELVGGLFVLCNPGDVDGSNTEPDISDLVYMVYFMFNGGPPPPAMESADVNGTGALDIADLVYLVDYMFTGGPAPVCSL